MTKDQIQAALGRVKGPYIVTLSSGAKLVVPTAEHTWFAPAGYWIVYEDQIVSYNVDPTHVVSVKGEPKQKTG